MSLEPSASFTISVVIPAWNEENRLGTTLDHYLPLLGHISAAHEVIVVVDGVVDRTGQVAEGYAEQGVRVLTHPTKLGKGGATVKGLRECRFDVIGFVDADSSLSQEELSNLVCAARNQGCSIGSRRFISVRGSKRGGRPLSRVILSALWKGFVRALFWMPITDTQCGAKFFRRDQVLPVLDSVEVTDWAFDVSILYHLWKRNVPIVEIPVAWIHEKGSKIRVARVTVGMFMSAMGLRLVNSPFRGRVNPDLVRRLRALVSQT